MIGADDDLWQALHRVTELPYGAGQIAAVEQLIRRADAKGDEHLSFAVRMVGTNAYVFGGEPAKSFVTFSWCLADFDRNPQPYHQRHEDNLLWHFKYLVSALLTFPEIPLHRTYAVLDDMERRYREGGRSLQAVYKYRHLLARHLGAADEAEQWYRRWTTASRDDLSDCAGCDPSAQVRHLAGTGRDEEAITLAEPVLAGRLSCVEQPQGILTSLLLPYLRTGRREAARDAHRRAYRRHRGNLADLSDIAEHIEFCAVTGNDARGLELVERHLDWLDRAPSPAAAMAFAASAALVLRGLAAAGHGELTVHRRGHGDRPAADLPVPVLAEELAAVATDLAARFDDRNGTSAQSRRIAQRLSREPIGEYLPISATVRRRPSGPPAPAVDRDAEPGPDPAGPDSEARSSGRPGPARVRPVVPFDLPTDATPAGLLALADEAWRTEREEHLLAALRAFDDRFGDQPQEPAVTARRVELRAVERHIADDLPGALAANREAITLYRQVPDPVREQLVTGRLGVLLVLAGEPGEGLPMVESSSAFLAEQGDPVQRATGYDRLAIVLGELDRSAEALDAAQRAATEAAGADDPHLTARIALHQSRFLELCDRRAEAGVTALRARDLYRELGLPEHEAVACIGYASSFDDPADAATAYDEAVRVATESTVLPARTGRARALMAAERPDEAIEDLVEAVAFCVERDIADGAAFLRWELAGAYQQAGRALDAAEVAEEAVLGLDRLGHQGDADRCRHLLADVYVALGEDDSALALLDQLAENLDGPDNLPIRAQVLAEAGDLLYRQDRDSLAAQRYAAAATAYRLAEAPIDELRARRREVAARHWAGEPMAALAALERAERVAASLPGELVAIPPDGSDEPGVEPAVLWERLVLADTAARALIGADRPAEALDRLRGVPDAIAVDSGVQ